MIKTRKDLTNYLNKLFPQELAEKWDFVGYSIKNQKNSLDKILITLDLNKDCCDFAIKNNVDIILCFHPFRFAKRWTKVYQYDKTKEKLVLLLKKNKIDVFTLHTNFEKHLKGTRYWIFKKCGWEKKIKKDFPYFSIIKYQDNFNNLVKEIKTNLNLNFIISNVKKNEQNKIINNFAFWGGAGDIYEIINNIKKEQLDLIITSDIKWNEQQLLNANDYKFMMVSHRVEEFFIDGMVYFLKDKLDKKISILTFWTKDFNNVY